MSALTASELADTGNCCAVQRSAAAMNALRECGDCSLCCKLLAVRELDKPKDCMCQHFKRGAGCMIYSARPESCKQFRCFWLDGLAPDACRPDRCGVVIDASSDGTRLVVHVRPDRPDAWKEGKMGDFLERAAQNGIDVVVVAGTQRRMLTYNPSTLVQLTSGNITIKEEK